MSVRFNCRILALTRVGVRVVNFGTAFCFYEPSVTVTVSRSFCCRLLQPVFDISIKGVTVQDLVAVHMGPSA
jgi:hypothetical protein